MKKKFVKTWKASAKPRKQRKYRFNAPLHIKGKFLNSHLSLELRKKHTKRSIRVRTGDKVKVMRGKFKDQSGKIESVDVKKTRIYIDGIDVAKKDGTKTRFSINPSNVMITELNLDDKKRIKNREKTK